MKNSAKIKLLLTLLTGWRQFFKILSRREKILFFFFLFLFLVSFSFLSINFYFENTEIRPAPGGTFVEGVIGQPRFVNPIYAPLSDIDRDLTQLLFSGLMRHNLKGEIIPDLATSYQILENGRVWKISLRENLFWSDGTPITADDLLFTIETIQNPKIKSPLRPKWIGVEAKKISDLEVKFKLKNPSAVFLENLTLKIIPKHIWENISPQNFPFSFVNLKPIGSGPFQFKNLVQDKKGRIISIDLIRNPYYHGKSPYLQQISFRFFEKEKDLLSAIRREEINGFTLRPTGYQPDHSFNLYSFSLPRYFAVFFNQEQSRVLTKKEVRQALNYGTNKEEIIEQILGGRGKIVDSPILPEIYGFNLPTKTYQFNLEEAKHLLEEAGFFETEKGTRKKVIRKEPAFRFKSDLKLGSRGEEVRELQRCLSKDPKVYPEGTISGYFGRATREAVIRFQERYRQEILRPLGLKRGTGEVRKATRNKLNEVCFGETKEVLPLKFSLATVDQPFLVEVANLLKEQWEKLGAKIEIETYDLSTLEREIIRPRNYEALLFGQVLGMIPDPFPFWHSSQKRNPGLNLSLVRNKEGDRLLEKARQNLNEKERKELLEKFQNILIREAPVVFLYNPDYLYFVSKEVKGIRTGIIANPSQRFSNIEEWYTKTKRAWKHGG